jgi:hypothetical protein
MNVYSYDASLNVIGFTYWSVVWKVEFVNLYLSSIKGERNPNMYGDTVS